MSAKSRAVSIVSAQSKVAARHPNTTPLVAESTPAPLSPASKQRGGWLGLEEAARRLGVHPSTLRRWADAGALPVFTTPGGHRRFRSSDLAALEERERNGSPSAHALWIGRAIHGAREAAAEQHWPSKYDDTLRATNRALGQRLVGLMMQYVSSNDDQPEVLREARAIGMHHGDTGLTAGESLQQVLEAMQAFRVTVLDAAIVQAPRPHGGADASSLLRRIERMMMEIQAGIVERYLPDADR